MQRKRVSFQGFLAPNFKKAEQENEGIKRDFY